MPFAYWCVTSGADLGIQKTDTGSFATTNVTSPGTLTVAPRNLTVTPDSTTVYVCDTTTTIYIIDTTSGLITGTITTALGIADVDLSNDGTILYAIHAATPSPTVYAYDVTGAPTLSWTVGPPNLSAVPSAQNINVTADGAHLWLVGNTQVSGNFQVARITTATQAVTSFALPATTATSLVSNVGISKDSTLGYVGMQDATNTGQVCAVLDLVGLSVVTSVALTLATTVTTRLYAVCNQFGTLAFVGLTNVTNGLGRVSVVDTVGNTELTSLTGTNFRGVNKMVITSDDAQVWFGNIANANGSVLAGVSPFTTLSTVLFVGSGDPNGVAVTKAGGEPIVMLT